MTLRHNCQQQGCYIKRQTPDWGFLDSALSGRIRVGDADGIVEANGCLLLFEWKGVDAKLLLGQQIMFEKITKKSAITVFVIHGDAAESQPVSVQVFQQGRGGDVISADREKIREMVAKWEYYVRDVWRQE